MNCHTVRALCELFGRDAGQFDADAQAALDRHLDACPACREWRQSDRQVDAALAAAMKNVTTPVGLERRIRDRLSAARPPRPWGWVAGASALVTIGLAIGIWWMLPQPVDLAALVNQINEPVATRESAEEHFVGLGYRVQMPDDVNYNFLQSFDLVSFQGRRAPRLTFFANSGKLNVYVLSTSAFRIPQDVVEPLTESNRHVLARKSGNFIYVYEWTGNALAELRGERGQ